jgi:hypothetical protein
MVVAKSLSELDHYRIFGSGIALGDWVWCLHCQRVYQYGEYRTVPGGFARNGIGVYELELQLCPYADCDGSPLDLWMWDQVQSYNRGYPVEPARGVEYSLYG